MAAISSLIRSGPTRAERPELVEQPIWRRVYRRFGAHIGFVVVLTLVAVGWSGREARQLSADTGLGYWLGVFAAICMLVLLLYPLRKRWRALRILGPARNWFRLHMMLGVVGPLAALYHCNFSLGSFNSRVALFSALLVASSGLVGRFLYRKIHHGLYGRKANLKELLAQINLTGPEGGRVASFVPELMRRVTAFDRSVLVPPKGIFDSIALLLRMVVVTRLQYWELMRFTRRRLVVEGVYSDIVAQHHKGLEKATGRFISKHLRQVRRVAEFSAYERLFALWHVVHLPFFLLLLVSAVIHVWAVHAY